MKILVLQSLRIFTTVYRETSEMVFGQRKEKNMAEMVKVVVDAMGGDNAPVEPVKAAVEAVKEKQNIQVILTGQEDVIRAELQKYSDYPGDRIRVVHASQVIETAEPPVMAIQKKKDSSIVVGLNLVKKQEADAFVSSGSTGAVLVGGQVIVGRIKGIQRPPPCSADPYSQRCFPSY